VVKIRKLQKLHTCTVQSISFFYQKKSLLFTKKRKK
jgi:hypothetical protein